MGQSQVKRQTTCFHAMCLIHVSFQASALDALSLTSCFENQQQLHQQHMLQQQHNQQGGGQQPTQQQQEESFLNVPSIVMQCIKHLEQHGLHTVGIFRVSSSKKRVRQVGTEGLTWHSTCLRPRVFSLSKTSCFQLRTTCFSFDSSVRTLTLERTSLSPRTSQSTTLRLSSRSSSGMDRFYICT